MELLLGIGTAREQPQCPIQSGHERKNTADRTARERLEAFDLEVVVAGRRFRGGRRFRRSRARTGRRACSGNSPHRGRRRTLSGGRRPCRMIRADAKSWWRAAEPGPARSHGREPRSRRRMFIGVCCKGSREQGAGSRTLRAPSCSLLPAPRKSPQALAERPPHLWLRLSSRVKAMRAPLIFTAARSMLARRCGPCSARRQR